MQEHFVLVAADPFKRNGDSSKHVVQAFLPALNQVLTLAGRNACTTVVIMLASEHPALLDDSGSS